MSAYGIFIGINRYQNIAGSDLRGCVNDALDFERLAEEQWDVIDGVRLLDAEATKANIMRELSGAVERARKGEIRRLYVSYAAHGTQVSDASGDERDGYDEAITCCDLRYAKNGDGFDANTLITDDELGALFAALPATCTLEMFLDTCHSGTGLRRLSIGDSRPRYISSGSAPALPAARRLSRGVARAPFRPRAVGRQILWTGCRANQTSADAYINGRPRGAFSESFCNITRSTGGKLTRLAVLRLVRLDLAKRGFAQKPQLEMYSHGI